MSSASSKYSNAQRAIHSKNLLTYQFNYGDERPNDNLYINLDGTYNVTNNRRSVKKGDVSDNMEELGKWLDLILDKGYGVDYTINIDGPHKILRFMDVDGLIWFLPFDANLPLELYPLEDYLDNLLHNI